MKYLSEPSVVDSWTDVIIKNEDTKGALNKFFGLLELLAHLNLKENEEILPNVQYSISSKELSSSLQNLYSFSGTTRDSYLTETLYIIFPNQWQKSVYHNFLRDQPLNIQNVAIICMQNMVFSDESGIESVVEEFKKKYHLLENENIFFDIHLKEIELTNKAVDREVIFKSLKTKFNLTENSKFTFGFSKFLYDKRAGELTAGPFIQPLYAGQENLKCLIIANFNIKDIYNIISKPAQVHKTIAEDLLLPRNKILYGAPGTGKSFALNNQAEESGFTKEQIIRVTFHPNYSYQQFIGTYKPTPIYKYSKNEEANLFASDKITQLKEPNNKEPLIDYSFVPGPLLIHLISALQNPNNNYLLIIEEINRANVSSVFGDVFQLLDRNSEGSSEYYIQFNNDISNYLFSSGIKENKIKLPSNLFIWATMNSADQGVMPLDSAFKRRWSFEYLPLNGKEDQVKERTIVFQNKKYNWNSFRNSINAKLKLINGISEDKLIGPFFLNKQEMEDSSSIKHKLLLYLRDDVVRHNPENLFLKRTFSDIINAYENDEEVFNAIELPQEIS